MSGEDCSGPVDKAGPSGCSWEDIQIGLFHRKTEGVSQSSVPGMCPGGAC